MMLDAIIYTEKIPKNIRNAMQVFTGNECLLVKHRRQGKTGAGQILNCHANVKSWVEKFGGEQIYGWVLHRNKKLLGLGAYIWNYHSIWKTPENKFADVTMNPLYDELDFITFWLDTNRIFDWTNLVSYNMIEVYENDAIAANVSRNMNYPICAGTVYWANNGMYMTQEEDNGSYKLISETSILEIKERFGIDIVEEEGKRKMVGYDKLSASQRRALLMKYSVHASS